MQAAETKWLETKGLEIMRGEFLEMPCLTLTLPQAVRLWGLDEPSCVRLLDRLISAGFLRRTADGCYRRNGAVS